MGATAAALSLGGRTLADVGGGSVVNDADARDREIDALMVVALRKIDASARTLPDARVLERAETTYGGAMAARRAATSASAIARSVPRHKCSFRDCSFASFRRAQRFRDPRSGAEHVACGDIYVCVRTGYVHHCTEDLCDAGDETPQGSVCRITRLVRQLISHFTLGSRRGHTESGDMALPTARVREPVEQHETTRQRRVVQHILEGHANAASAIMTRGLFGPTREASASATDSATATPSLAQISGTATMLVPAPAAAAAPVPRLEADWGASAARRSGRRNATSVARLERIYFGNSASKEEEARRIVTALLCNGTSEDLRRARYDAALDRADASVVAYLSDCAARHVRPVGYEIFARFAQHVPRITVDGAYVHLVPSTPTHAVDYYVHACMATWQRVCKSEVACDTREKRHPSFRKHCLGVLYRMRNGYFVPVVLDAADFGPNTSGAALLAHPIVRHLTLLAKDPHLALALPDYADVDAIIASGGIAGDKKYAREGCNMLRDCYHSLIASLRSTLRAQLAMARDRATIAAAITAFLTGIQSLEYASVVGPPPDYSEQSYIPVRMLGSGDAASTPQGLGRGHKRTRDDADGGDGGGNAVK